MAENQDIISRHYGEEQKKSHYHIAMFDHIPDTTGFFDYQLYGEEGFEHPQPPAASNRRASSTRGGYCQSAAAAMNFLWKKGYTWLPQEDEERTLMAMKLANQYPNEAVAFVMGKLLEAAENNNQEEEEYKQIAMVYKAPTEPRSRYFHFHIYGEEEHGLYEDVFPTTNTGGASCTHVADAMNILMKKGYHWLSKHDETRVMTALKISEQYREEIAFVMGRSVPRAAEGEGAPIKPVTIQVRENAYQIAIVFHTGLNDFHLHGGEEGFNFVYGKAGCRAAADAINFLMKKGYHWLPKEEEARILKAMKVAIQKQRETVVFVMGKPIITHHSTDNNEQQHNANNNTATTMPATAEEENVETAHPPPAVHHQMDCNNATTNSVELGDPPNTDSVEENIPENADSVEDADNNDTNNNTKQDDNPNISEN